MSTANLTGQDLDDLGDLILAEIAKRMKNPKNLSGAQLLSAAREVGRLAQLRADDPRAILGGEDLDLLDLVERLPDAERRKHLLAERLRLQERLDQINTRLGGKP